MISALCLEAETGSEVGRVEGCQQVMQRLGRNYTGLPKQKAAQD